MQMLHDALEIPAHFVQMADAHGGFHRLFQRLQRVAAIRSRFGDVVGYRRAAGQYHVVGQGHVRGHHRAAAGDELPADLGRASHHEAGRITAFLPQVAVVRDVANVVELGARTDMSGGERRTVDGAIAADFNAIADPDVTEVGNLARRAVGLDRIAEAVAAY